MHFNIRMLWHYKVWCPSKLTQSIISLEIVLAGNDIFNYCADFLRSSYMPDFFCLLGWLVDWFVFWDRVSLCNPGWSWICTPPASTSLVLGLQCATTADLCLTILRQRFKRKLIERLLRNCLFYFFLCQHEACLCFVPMSPVEQSFLVFKIQKQCSSL
jgi:hypothetical protein